MIEESKIRKAEDATSRFCEVCMRALATAIRGATPESPVGRAIVALKAKGTFYDVATEALRAEIRRVLFDERDRTAELVSGAFATVGSAAVVADVISGTLQTIQTAAA